jgi:hypothetical protein
MPAASWMYAVLVVLVLCSAHAASTNEQQQQVEDELDAQHSRAFLEKATEQLSQDKSLLRLVRNSSFKERLDQEVDRMFRAKGADRRELLLLQALREFLYGQLDEARCELGAKPPFKLKLQNLAPGSSLAKLVDESAQPVERSAGTNKLNELLLDQRLKQIEFCKPSWDRTLDELIETRLDEKTRQLMFAFHAQLIALTASHFGPEDVTAVQTRDSGIDTFDQFTALLSEPPKPANLLLFMNERFPTVAGKFQLDQNMQNPKLERATLVEAVQKTIVPLCTNVCNQLQLMGNFYASEIFQLNTVKMLDADETNQFIARLDKLFRDQPARTTKALVVQAACCKLLSDKAGPLILRSLYNTITGNRRPRSPRMSDAPARAQA